MRQKETTATTRFSLLPGSITRFFLLLIIVLLVTMGVMVQSAVNAWLKDKRLSTLPMLSKSASITGVT